MANNEDEFEQMAVEFFGTRMPIGGHQKIGRPNCEVTRICNDVKSENEENEAE